MVRVPLARVESTKRVYGTSHSLQHAAGVSMAWGDKDAELWRTRTQSDRGNKRAQDNVVAT